METMSEKIDRFTEENRALRVQTPVPATHPLPSPPIDTTSAVETETDGASDPAPAGEAAEEYLPHTNSHALCA